MTEIEYPYSKENLFINQQKYQMTKFVGKEFLLAYKNSRSHVINYLEKNFEILTLENLIPKLQNLLSSYDKNSEPKIIISTQILLKSFIAIFKNNLQSSEKNLIDKFLKKFEIKKMIFYSYDQNFVVLDDNYNDLLNYLLLSGICELSHEQNSNLKFLNCALKINDVICSQIFKIDSLIHASFAHIILKHELASVQLLAEDKEIDII